MAKLIGYQMANDIGGSIQGDEECPTGFASFEVMTPECANAVMERVSDECTERYLLQPIYEGDVEAFTMVDETDIETNWRA